MMNFHRLREPRFGALRPVDLRPEALPVLERLRALALPASAALRGIFCAVGRERLRPVSLPVRLTDLRAPLRLRARLIVVSRLTILLKLLFCPRAVVSW